MILLVDKESPVKDMRREHDVRAEHGFDAFDELYQKRFTGNRHNSMDRHRFHNKFHNDVTSTIRNKDRSSDGALNVYNDIFHNYPPFANR